MDYRPLTFIFIKDLALGIDAEGQKVKDAMRVLLPVLFNKYDNYDKIRAILLYIFSINGNRNFIFMYILKYTALKTLYNMWLYLVFIYLLLIIRES